jgi:hypothetical protein
MAHIELDLTKINAKLVKHGETPLKAIYGTNNCAVCFGCEEVEEWSILVPCGHIICTICMKKIQLIQQNNAITCSLCRDVGHAYKLKKHKYEIDATPIAPQIPVYRNITINVEPFTAFPSAPPVKPPIIPTMLQRQGFMHGHNINNMMNQYTNTIDEEIKSSIFPNIPEIITEEFVSTNSLKYNVIKETGLGLVKLQNVTNITTQNPIDVVLLLDVSGSMQHEFSNCCTMCKNFISTMNSYDRFSLITFSSKTTQPFSLRPIDKDLMLPLIEPNINWGSSTNMKNGIIHATKVIQDGIIAGRTMYFILVTDGKADLHHEGIEEMKQLIAIPNLIIKMCTFGNDIEANILTDVLSSKIQDYEHLENKDDFEKLMKVIGVDRLEIIADNIVLNINMYGINIDTQHMAQLRTNEEILLPITINTFELPEILDISISYTDKYNVTQNLIGTFDDSLNSMIMPVFNKKTLTQDMMVLLDDINTLQHECLSMDKETYDKTIIQYNARLGTILKDINEKPLGIFKVEILKLYTTIETVLGNAKDVLVLARQTSTTNTAYSQIHRMVSGRTPTT